MRFVGFIGPSYTMNSVNVDCQRCVNLYPELDELGSGKEKEVAALIWTPGLRKLLTLGAGPVRATYEASNGRVFVVSANKLYELDSDWNSTELGTLNSETGPISMADDGYYLIAVDGGDGYKFEFETNTYAEILDANFLGADQVVVLDGYFIFNKPDASSFYLSTSVTERIVAGDMNPTFPGDESGVDGSPDLNKGLVVCNENLWSLNEKTIEVYFNSGDVDFPFGRVQGAFIEYGCGARFSAVKMNNTMFWLGRDEHGSGIVFKASGYQPQRISTHPVEQAIQSYGDITDTTAYCYQQNGHNFYVLNFPNANTTWVYDTTTSLWHERAYNSNGTLQRHRANCHAFAFSTHIVGDYENGNIYELTPSVFTDDGEEISRVRVTPHTSDGMKLIFYHGFQLDIESGTGLDGSGQGTDPQVVLQYSDDGGHTWSNEKWASFGKIGQTKRRAKWRRLGAARDRVFKITITDPVKVVLIGAEMDIVKGMK